jgi:hypothetical protein
MFPSWKFYNPRQGTAEARQLLEIDDSAARADSINFHPHFQGNVTGSPHRSENLIHIITKVDFP